MEGIVYKVQSYLESSKLLFTYTPKGKITLIAKGAQKLNSNDRILGQYLNHISFEEMPGKEMYTLKSAKLIHDFAHIKNDFEDTKKCASMLEIIDKAIKADENHELIFTMLTRGLSSKNLEYSQLSFALKVLDIIGYGINLEADGRKIKGLSLSEARLIYLNEDLSYDLSLEQTIHLLKLQKMPFEDLESLNLETKSIHTFIKKYYEYHLNIQLKTFV